MKGIYFPNWDAVLARTELPERLKRTFGITIRWYLSFCRRSRAGVNHDSARGFIEWAQDQKQPETWQVEQWKEAIRSIVPPNRRTLWRPLREKRLQGGLILRDPGGNRHGRAHF